MSVEAATGASGDVEDASEAVPELGRKSAGDHVHRFEDLRADAGREMLVGVIKERDAINKLVQRQLVAPQMDEVVMARNRTGNQVLCEGGNVFGDAARQQLQIMVAESERRARLLHLGFVTIRLDVHFFLYLGARGEFELQTQVLTRPQQNLGSTREIERILDRDAIVAGFQRRETKTAARV